MASQIKMPDKVRNYLENILIGRSIKGLKLNKVLGNGNTAVTYETEDNYGIPHALKLVLHEYYEDRAPFREIARFSLAQDERFLVFPKDVWDWNLKLEGLKYTFVCFKSRCVRGLTLNKFLESNIQFSASLEIQKFIENITAALEELRRMGFCHGDLNNGNIMREEIGLGGPIPETRYVIIDFSEAHPIDAADEGLAKDMEWLGAHLRSFSDAIHRREVITREDDKILRAIGHIPGLLSGMAPESMGISRPLQVLERFKDALGSAEESIDKLKTPFDSLSAEYIANDALLALLCYTKTPWVSDLEANKNILLIGPRGCGKTMIFRRLRLKTKVVANKLEEIESDPYIGFYLPCESLFYMRFSDLSEAYVDYNKDALVLFFNMAVLAEVASTLSSLPLNFGPVSASIAVEIGKHFKEEIGDLWREINFPEVMASLEEIAVFAENVMRYLHKSIAYRREIQPKGSTAFLSELVNIVKREVPGLSSRFFIFFLDDYTEERVPLALQEALHPIVCQRSSDMCFKISAHMFGSIYNSPRPLSLDEGRNIIVINLGSAYLKLNKRRREGKLLLEILNERFEHCSDYNGKIEDWLGDRSYAGGRTLSESLRDDSTTKAYYHGYQCLMDLCTGDYSEMIRMVGEIFREAGIKPNSPLTKINPSIQDKAIDRVSREYLGRIRHIRPDGKKLYDFVDNFGKLSRGLLRGKLIKQGTDSKGQPRLDPCDLLTIYVDDLMKASRSSRQVWERLQKASIFVDIGLAPSQRTVVAERSTMRRIYCPAFKTTLTSSEHLQLRKDQFEWIMDKPKEFCEDYLRRRNIAQSSFWEPDRVELIKEKEEPTLLTLPDEKDCFNFVNHVSKTFSKKINEELPLVQPLGDVIKDGSIYDLFIGAFGFEERTIGTINELVNREVHVRDTIILEFDMYYEATQKRKEVYEKAILAISHGKPYIPFNAPVTLQDALFPERLKSLLESFSKSEKLKILFDCSSCPSVIHSQTLRVLLEYDCDLTILYSEATKYYPLREEWESGGIKPRGGRVQGPFEGVRFVAKPPILQASDIGELPVLLVLFPTFNTERTDGILADLDPAARIWLFGEPHDLSKNDYRIDMAKAFATTLMYPGDKWSLISTFDYRQTILGLTNIYANYRPNYRIVIMPHGSKMQVLGVSLFSIVNEISMVFALPKTYDTKRYSEGCLSTWAINLGDTLHIITQLRSGRGFN